MSVLLQGAIFSFPRGLHEQDCHQYYKEWIQPYFTLAHKNDSFKFFFYISGTVFDYLMKYAKEYIVILKEMSQRKQIEILHGMYYDSTPIFQSKEQKKEQLEKLSHYISSKNLDTIQSKGCWLESGTYEQNIVGTISEHGLNFLLIDRAYLEPPPDAHTLSIVDALLGKKILALPYNETLYFSDEEHSIVQQDVEKLLKNDESSYIVWFAKYTPQLHSKKYFSHYASLLKKMKSMQLHSQSVLPSIAIPFNTKRNICRIRTTPYGVDEYKSLFNFLTNRYESRLLYSYALYVFKKVSKYKKNKDRRLIAISHVHEEQEHFTYWKYNAEWGIHNSILRQKKYQSLGNIVEYLIAGTETKTSTNISRMQTDINLDGIEETIIESNNHTIIVEPEFASIILMQKRQKKKKRWNYLSCYAPFANPQFIPSSFREMLIPPEDNIETLHAHILRNNYTYAPITYNSKKPHTSRSEIAYETYHRPPLYIEKKYSFFKNGNMTIQYTFNNCDKDKQFDQQDITMRFVVELNVSLAFEDTKNIQIMCDKKKIKTNMLTESTCQTLSLVCSDANEIITIQIPNHTCMASISPVIGTEDIEDMQTYQYHSILLSCPLSLAYNTSEECNMHISFSQMKNK